MRDVMINLQIVLLTIALSIIAFHYNSYLAGIGAIWAFFSIKSLKDNNRNI